MIRLAIGTIVGLLTTASIAAAQTEPQLEIPTMPLSALKAGMVGTGHTVIRGTKIETFNVEVLDLIPDGGFDGGPMVLARFTGPVIDFSNGIAGGYSGSPVYINGKLLGAVSAAIPFTDTHVGGITPIESMLKALPDGEEPNYQGNTVLPPASNNGQPLDKDGNLITWVHNPAEARLRNDMASYLGQPGLAAVPMTTPILTSGLSPLVLKNLQDKLPTGRTGLIEFTGRPMGKASDMGLLASNDQAASAGSGLLLGGSADDPPLKAGDACAVSLVQGDIEMYAIGTVTYSDKQGRVLIFGHPMMQVGSTNMPLGKAYVTWTYTSIQRAFKEGVRLNTVGTLTKDHLAACGGTFNQQPDLIPVKITVNDVDTGQREVVKLQVYRDPDMTPMLIAAGMSQALSRELDRQPGGTLKMSYHVEGNGLTEPLRRENYYSNDVDVISDAAFDLVPLSNLLQTNIYREVRINKVEVLCEITRNRINASIDDAEIIWDKNKAAAIMGSSPTLPALSVTEPNQPVTQEGGKEDQADEAPGSALPGAGSPGMLPQGMYNPMANMPTFQPGETIQIKVRLQPYRTAAVWRMFEVKVPDDFPSGTTMVVVHGGGDLVSMSEFGGKGRQLFGFGPMLSGDERDLDSLLDQVQNWPLNNELVVTLMRPYDPAQAQQFGSQGSSTNPMGAVSAGSAPGDEKKENKIDAKYQMEWVIYNGFYLPVNIMSQKDLQAMQAAMAQAGAMPTPGGGGEGSPVAGGSDPAKPEDDPQGSETRRQPDSLRYSPKPALPGVGPQRSMPVS